MEFNIINIVLIFITGVIGIAAGAFLAEHNSDNNIERIQEKNKLAVKQAQLKAKTLMKQAQENSVLIQEKIKELDNEAVERKADIQERIEIRSEKLKKRELKLKKREERFQGLYKDLEELDANYKAGSSQISEQLEQKAKLDVDSAKQELSNNLDKEFASFIESYPSKMERITKDKSAKAAINILQGVIQKYTQPSSVDRLDKTVYLPRLADKERIIGKDFENLKYLVEKTDVDIIFDDTPKHVTVSHFVLVKQEIARITIMNLIGLRKVNPAIIDKAYEAAVKEMDQILLEDGKEAAKILELKNIDPELLRLIGRLKYRTSYGQNILYHSYEIAYFCAMMASEIGCDVRTATLAGFFHDIGKAIDQEDGRPHDVLTKEILERFDFSPEIVHAAWAHHDGEPQQTPEAHIVIAADKISAGRPGARSETGEQYVERIQSLEKIALEAPGVIKAYALSAGREMRIYLDESQKKDKEMPEIADAIAQEIEENVVYPGKIKVNLIRIFKAVDFANRKSK